MEVAAENKPKGNLENVNVGFDACSLSTSYNVWVSAQAVLSLLA